MFTFHRRATDPIRSCSGSAASGSRPGIRRRLDFFGTPPLRGIAVQTRTMTDAVKDKANPPISYVANDACRAVQFVRLNAAKWKLDPERIAVGRRLTRRCRPVCRLRRRPSRSAIERPGGARLDQGDVRRGLSQPAHHRPETDAGVGPGVEWGALALGCGFEESLEAARGVAAHHFRVVARRLAATGPPSPLLRKQLGTDPTECGGEKPTTRFIHPLGRWAFRNLAQQAGVECHVKYPDHPDREIPGRLGFHRPRIEGSGSVTMQEVATRRMRG